MLVRRIRAGWVEWCVPPGACVPSVEEKGGELYLAGTFFADGAWCERPFVNDPEWQGRRDKMPLVVAPLRGATAVLRWMAESGWIRAQPTDPSQARMTPTSTTPKTSRASAAAKLPASYEAALEELEQLVAQIDAGQLPLDQLLSRYQRGAQLLAFCRERLAAVETQIQQLEGGELKPWSGA